MIDREIKKLVSYALSKNLITEHDRAYIINQIIDTMGLDAYTDTDISDDEIILEDILGNLCDYAVQKGIIKDSVGARDLFDTRIMGLLVPRPGEVAERFSQLYRKSPADATEYFYQLSCDSDYIRRYRIKKDKKWKHNSFYGELDITINLSKPEKDPRDIAMAKKLSQSGYPRCLLCRENEGYAGRIDSPARQNHRIIPLRLNGEDYFLQYSPYVYYNEHCIVFCKEHIPMRVDKNTFIKILDFAEKFPHYFLGSNADLPVVGGSILTHDHFQGGNYNFAMEKAEIERAVLFKGYEDVDAGIVKWPMSCIRIKSKNKTRLSDLAERILTAWRNYTDDSAFIFAETNGEQHNTITPIARNKNGVFELDLVLRNNITTDEHPMGVYHPHSELHNIKKENIGLIEVMGLAVLPSRLDNELNTLAELICKKEDISSVESVSKHAKWVDSFIGDYDDINKENIHGILREEVGKVFVKVLEHAGVYKCNEEGRKAFLKFINSVK